MSLGNKKELGFQGDLAGLESQRDYRAFCSLVELVGGVDKVADSVLQHTGVAKKWVLDWYGKGLSPSVNIIRQIFVELRHMAKEVKADPKASKPSVAEKPASPPLQPEGKNKVAVGGSGSPKKSYRQTAKEREEKRHMQDPEYAALRQRLIDKGLIEPSPGEKRNE